MPFPEQVDNHTLARLANHYARFQIREGTSQLQNNLYDIDKQAALNKALADIRQAFAKEDFFLNIETTITRFEKRIADCKKFSIGNCHELALMALDYMIRNQPNVHAEVYSIEGGDHAFLVIGRKIDSDPEKPETWGDEAYICDPWSNHVYPAAEYLDKTKNFYYITTPDGRQINYIEDFDPSRHKMVPVQNQNSIHFLQESSKLNTILLDVFTTINERHCAIFDELANDLNEISIKLNKKYGQNDPKVKILNEKINIIREETAKMRSEFNDYAQRLRSEMNPETYHAHKEINDDLQRMMKNRLKNLREAKVLSTEESTGLDTYRKEDSLITIIMKFLHIKPTSSREYKAAISKSEEQLSEFSDLITTSLRT
ncbi:Uncharacterised protein [Legionella longbeachae]|uniref:Uncharacterized protein n=2 Tax=Legionella oakridgensis TaxID=29423 RepID=A0A0W0WY99_9GAMM|nr:hypothetical protein LOR_77c22200 [Legionella oakridgensis RV-2-2007]KTD37280.1 hypothetical protein Loak_2416 [Legionella oakridgensis]STY21120.1 Uncharacterised protein [Legionella longbeachae]